MSNQVFRKQFAQAYPPGTKVVGTVMHAPAFGVFLQLDKFPDDVSALLEIIHVPNLDYTRYPNDFPIGSRIEAQVLGWPEECGQVRLTQLSSLNPDPQKFSEDTWNELTQSYPAGTKVSGTVLRSTSFGVFVEVDDLPLAQALVMLPSMLNYSSLRYPEDYPAAGSRIEAYILQWVEHSYKLSLSQCGPEPPDLA